MQIDPFNLNATDALQATTKKDAKSEDGSNMPLK
jgi:hypothetical protein